MLPFPGKDELWRATQRLPASMLWEETSQNLPSLLDLRGKKKSSQAPLFTLFWHFITSASLTLMLPPFCYPFSCPTKTPSTQTAHFLHCRLGFFFFFFGMLQLPSICALSWDTPSHCSFFLSLFLFSSFFACQLKRHWPLISLSNSTHSKNNFPFHIHEWGMWRREGGLGALPKVL